MGRVASQITERRDPLQEFADSVIAELEKGVKPWARPWDETKCGLHTPHNPVTHHNYRGCNVLILGTSKVAFETGDPRWMTYQQAREKGWNVKKSERSTTIFFTKTREVEDDKADDGKKTFRILKHFAVFHASQVEGPEAYKTPGIEEAPWRRPESANLILANSKAVLRIGGPEAYYSPTTDHIQLPPESAFRGAAEWACVALHEAGHWSGHESRLNRNLTGRFGSAAYAMEELRAELASAFLAAELGIPAEIPNHASYIEHWLKPLKSDKRVIFQAAADAQRIVDYLLAYHPDFIREPDRPELRPPTAAEHVVPAG